MRSVTVNGLRSAPM
jgi:hypothetical protein